MTFLRWAGSKKQLLDILSSCWHASQCAGGSGRYLEAFSGSAALFFRIRPKMAVLVDVNHSLQECMEMVKTHPLKVATLIRKYDSSEDSYYKARAEDETNMTQLERSARFIYLNHHSFNGLYRTNQLGKFNVPYGKSKKTGPVPDERSLLEASRVLKAAKIIRGDFHSILENEVSKGDFLYMDPPYAKANERIRNQYGANVFGTQDIARLGELAEQVDKRGAHFVISYAKCKEIENISRRWTCEEVFVNRTIAAQPQNRQRATELLITNI